jgi:hypothetical protein
VREHDGLGFGADGGFDFAGIDVVGEVVHIHKDRHRAKLQDGVDGGGEAGRHANDFVAFLNGALTQLGRCEGAEGHQVGRRARVDGDQVLDTDEGGQFFLELGVEAA